MAIWAHNSHVSRNSLFMGGHLLQKGIRYSAVGFLFNQGSFRALGTAGSGMKVFTVGPARPDAVEAVLAKIGEAAFLVDFHASQDDCLERTLGKLVFTRWIGSVYEPTEADAYYREVKVISSFDGAVFVDSTSPSKALRAQIVIPQRTPTNLSFAGPSSSDGVPEGWGHPRFSREGGYIVETAPCDGVPCAILRSSRAAEAGRFGNLMQSVSAEPYRGRTIRYSADVSVEPADEESYGALWLRVDGPGTTIGFFDNMQNRPIKSKEWHRYEIVATVGEKAEWINFGAMLMGAGTVRVRRVSVTTPE
jgi:hypothetical protein